MPLSEYCYETNGMRNLLVLQQRDDRAAWMPSADEASFYDALFAAAELSGTGELQGAPAVAFFQRSGLERPILKQIWTESNLRGGPALSRHEFHVAMRLVALAQAGKPPTRESLEANIGVPLPLPRIDGFSPPVANANASPWVISAADRSKYDAVFAAEDSDNDGYISGPQAVVLFGKSGLEKNKLRQIWVLSDMDKDARLDREEFYVAMHLVVGASKRGVPVPEVVPEALVPPSKRHFMPAGISSAGPAVNLPPTMSNSGVGGTLQARPASGSMSLADALDAHINMPDAPSETAHAKASMAVAAPSAPLVSAGSSVPETGGSVPPFAPALRSSTGLPAGSNSSMLSQSFRPDVAQQTPPAEIVATAKDLESAMQSHLKRENTLLNDRRALNDSLAAELKFLDMERQVFMKQLDSVKAQITEEDTEYRSMTAALQGLRGEVARLKEVIRQENSVGENARNKKHSVAASLSALAAGFVVAGGNVALLESDIQNTVQALLGAQAATQALQAEVQSIHDIADSHAGAAADASADAAALESATAQLANRASSLELQLASHRAKLVDAVQDVNAVIVNHNAGLIKLDEARKQHVASIIHEAEAKASFSYANRKCVALEEAIAALHKIEAAGAASQGRSPMAPPPGATMVSGEASLQVTVASMEVKSPAKASTNQSISSGHPGNGEIPLWEGRSVPGDSAAARGPSEDGWLSPAKAPTPQGLDASFSGFDDFGPGSIQATGGEFGASFASFDNVPSRPEPAGTDGFGDFDSFGSSHMQNASAPAPPMSTDDWSMSF